MKINYSTGDIVIIADNNNNKVYIDFSEIPQVVVGLCEAMNYAVDSIVLWRKTADLADEHEIWGKEEV